MEDGEKTVEAVEGFFTRIY